MNYYVEIKRLDKIQTELDRHHNFRTFLDSKKSSRKQGMRKTKKRGKRK